MKRCRICLGLVVVVSCLIVVSVASFAPGVAQESTGGTTCADWAVATAPLPPGSPLVTNEVVLTWTDGAAAMTVPFDQPAQVIPATLDDRSLIRSLGGEYGLLDSTAGTVTMLEFEGTDPGTVSHESFLFFESAGTRFHLFGDTVGLAGYLVDLQTGASLALAELIDEPAIVVRGAVSADDQWLTFFPGRESYLVRLSPPGRVVPVDEQDTTVFATFTDDSRFLVFQRKTGSNTTEIVARLLDSGEEQTIAPSGEWLGATTFPEGIVVAWRDGQIARLSLDGAEPVPIVELPGDLFPMMVDPTGKHLLVWQPANGQDIWHLVNLDGSGFTVLPELEGMSPLVHSRKAGWALFATDLAPLQGTPGASYLSLDLTTGIVTTLLTQDGEGIYSARLSAIADGQFELVQSISTARGRLWLLDAASGTATLVAESTGNVVGAVTPDGCFLATGTFDALGEGRQGHVTVLDLSSGEVVTTIPDAVLLGWAKL